MLRPSPSARKHASALAVSAAAAVAFALFVSGYSVFTNDHTQYLLMPFRSIFPGFCPRDWLVWETSHYHYTFSYLIRGLYVLAAGRIELAIFALWGVFFVGFFHAAYLLVTALKGGIKEYVLVLAMLLLYAHMTVGGTPTFSFQVVPSFMAFVTTLYALGFLLSDRPLPAFAVLGLATFFHVNYGVLGMPVFAAYTLLNFRRPQLRAYLAGGAAFILIGLPSLVPAFMNFGAKGHNEGLRLVYYVRSPHHYLPQAFPLYAWVTSTAPLILAVFVLFRQHGNRRERTYLGLALAFILFFAVSTGIDGPFIFKKIYPFRFTPLFLLFAYAVIARYLVTGGTRSRIFVFSSLAVLAASALVKERIPYAITAHLALTAFSAAVVYIPWHRIRIPGRPAVPVTAALLVLVAACSGLGRGTFVPGFANRSLFFREPLTEAIKKHVPRDGLILSPPRLSGLRLNTGRSIVGNYPGVPMGNGSEMVEWADRLERITGAKVGDVPNDKDWPRMYRLDGLYMARTPNQVRSVMDHYGADHFLTYAAHHDLPAFEQAGFVRLFSNDEHVIFRLAPAPAADAPVRE